MKKISLSLLLSALFTINFMSVNAEETTFSVTSDSVFESNLESRIEDQPETSSFVEDPEISNDTSISEAKTGEVKSSTPQGPYITDGSYVKISKKNYEIWQNFNWKQKDTTNNHFGKIYHAKGRYEHQNGQTYYSLYDNKGNWVGYLNKNATTKTVKEGPYISDGGYVKVKKRNYDAWNSFAFNGIKTDRRMLVDEIYQARGRYEHFNGSVYYSLYDNKGVWKGYINKAAVIRTTVKEGPYMSDGRDVKIVKKNYEIWQNFSWKQKSNTNKYYGQTLKARGRYYHFNGNRYYSLYDNKGKWVGYLNANATEVVRLKGGGRPTTTDELDKSYVGIPHITVMTNTGLTFETDEEIQRYMEYNNIRRGNAFDVRLKNSNKILKAFQYADNDSKPFFPNEY